MYRLSEELPGASCCTFCISCGGEAFLIDVVGWQVAERALMLWRSDGVRNLLRGWVAEVLPRFLPALLAGSEGHWNKTVLKLIGVVLGLLEEMTLSSGDEPGSGARMFEQACVDCKTTAEVVRTKALELNPPPDATAIAAARAATEGAIKQRQDDKSFNVYSVALGHELAVGTFSRVRFGKLILKGLDQSLWPEVAVKIQERAVSVLSSANDLSNLLIRAAF